MATTELEAQVAFLDVLVERKQEAFKLGRKLQRL